MDFNRIASHNSYAKLLGETGLGGVIPYALLMVLLTVRGAFSAVSLTRQGGIWAIAVYASFIGMSIHMFAIDNLGNTSPWFIYGLVAGMIERSKNTSESPV